MEKSARNTSIIIIVCAFFLGAFLALPAFTEEGKYVGSLKCKGCHSLPKTGAQYKSWVTTKHAKSMETLKAKGEDKNEKCLACHTTGYGKSHEEGANLEEVGCEACHGPASEWKNTHQKDKEGAIAKGLVMPKEETCEKCHNSNSPNFKGFNFAEYSKKGVHEHKK
ncbi:cytochrome c family protein [bacterium]|nr:cytochrome c family protein [bacterium]